MKGRIRSKRTVSMLLMLLIGVALIANVATKQTRAAASQKDLSRTYLNATEKYLNFNSKKTRSFDFDIKQEAEEKGAKYAWYVKADKGDADVVTINSKTGLVTAKKAGTAYIRCKITRADGTVIRPEAKVIVRNNITKVDISNLPKDMTIVAGKAMDFNRSILDTDAGKKVASTGITRWEIEDDFAGVIKATDSGLVFPVREGDFNIRVVCFQSKDKYNQWLKDKEGNAKYLTATSKWYLVNVKDSDGKAVVSNKEQLEKALAADNIKEITLSTKKDINLIIKKGDYSDKSLVVDAPNAEIENFAVFKEVKIAAIKENTWSENAQGNSFHVTSIKIRIIVNGEAVIRDIIIDREDTEIEIEIEGTIQRITVLHSAELNLSGDGEQVPITIEKTGTGTRITTSIPVVIKAEEDIEIKVLPGAEGTSIEKRNKDIRVKVENNSLQPVSITSRDGEEEVVEAGEGGTSDGTAQPTSTPTPTPIPASGGGGGGGYTPPAASLERIAIRTPASKTEYKVGEALSIAGLTIEGTYSDGGKEVETITTANISGFNSEAVTESQTLTVTISGKTTSYTISVIKADGPALTGVSRDDALNTISGMTSAMEFSTNGSTWTTYNAEVPNLPDLTGTVKLYVRNKETDTHIAGAATEFQFILGVLESISIKKPADKLVYIVGEALDISGLIIQGNYSDGGVKEETFSIGNISGFDSSNATADQELTITIAGKEEAYTVQIEPIPLDSITIAGDYWAYETLTACIVPEEATADYSWLISDTLDGEYEVIPGEKGELYNIRLSDAGKYIKVSATGIVNYDSTVTSTATEMIQAYVEEISLDRDELILYEDGDDYTLSVTILPDEATDKSVTWESSNNGIVSVENGVVTPVSEGVAVITVTANTGSAWATCNVTVKDSTPDNNYSGITGIDREILGSKQITFFIEASNSANEGIPGLSASDFTVDIKHESDNCESISLTDSTWFKDFEELGDGGYDVTFIGEENYELYKLYNLKAKGIIIHEGPYNIITPRGIRPILQKATISEDGTTISLEFDKAMQAPEEESNFQFKIFFDNGGFYLPTGIALKDDSSVIELYVPDFIPFLKNEEVSLDYYVDDASDILIESEDEGLLAGFSGFEVVNQSLATISISIEPDSLTESAENNGSLVSGAISINIVNTIIDPDTTRDDILVENLPAGMDYTISIDMPNIINVNIIGSAQNHANKDDINNLYFILNKDIVARATEDIVTDYISIDFITPSMTGTVSITGSNKYGQTLTADIADLVHVGTPAYQWLRDGEPISGATEQTYTLVNEDIGEFISVRVTADGLTGSGSISSDASDEIIKADGPALTGVSRDDALNTMSGMKDTMEFSTDGSSWTAYDSDESLPDLTGDITLWVRYAATATHEAGPAITFGFTEGKLEGIGIKYSADKTVYIVGDALDITGLVIQGNYSDGGKRELEFAVKDIDGFNSENVVPNQTLTISIGGFSTTYDIKINPRPLGSIGDIIGTTKDKEMLTAGTVVPPGATVNYQWLVSDNDSYVPIDYATESTYTLTKEEVGKFIKVSATGMGNYTATVYSEATTEVSPITVIGVSLNKETLSLMKNWDSETLIATVEPHNATNTSLIWTSSDETVAMVDEDGLVETVGVGLATITVKTVDGEYEDTCEVTVDPDTIPDTDNMSYILPSASYPNGSMIIELIVNVKNQDGEGITDLTSDDFVVSFSSSDSGTNLSNRSFSEEEWFSEFTEGSNGTYSVKFTGEGNDYAYSFSLKVKDVELKGSYSWSTPSGIVPKILSIEVNEAGTGIIMTFDKDMQLPSPFSATHYYITANEAILSPISVGFYDLCQIAFYLGSEQAILSEAEVKFSYSITFTSVDRGYLESQLNLEVTNNSTLATSIDYLSRNVFSEDIELNNGSLVDGSLSINIINGIFNTDISGDDVIASNLPTGLSYKVVRASNTQIHIVISGVASSHEEANSIHNLFFTISNEAILGTKIDLTTGMITILFHNAVDKSALTAAITAELGEDYSSDPHSFVLNESDYTTESWETYLYALENALYIEEDPYALQTEVDDILDELNGAKASLEFVNQELYDTIMYDLETLDESHYTSESWSAFSLAIDDALAMPHNTNAEMGDKIDALIASYDLLIDKLIINYVSYTRFQPGINPPAYDSLDTVTLRVMTADGNPYNGTRPGAVTLQEKSEKGLDSNDNITINEIIWDPNIDANGYVTITYRVSVPIDYNSTAFVDITTSDGSASLTLYLVFDCVNNYNYGDYTYLKTVSHN